MTVGIQREPAQRRWGRRLALTVVALSLLAVLGVVGWRVAWATAEQRAREKIDEVAARAGLIVRVDSIPLSWNSPIALGGVEVVDPHDDLVLARIARLRTDLTVREIVREERRRPSRLLLEGLTADLTDPDRLRAALARYRRGATGSSSGPARALEVGVVDASATLPDPRGGSLPLTGIRGTLRRGPDRWTGAVEARLGAHALRADGVKPDDGPAEVGVRFDPPFVATHGDLTVRLAAAVAIQDAEVRLRDVEIERKAPGQATDQKAIASHVTLTGEDGLSGALSLVVHRLRGTAPGLLDQLEAAAVRVDFAAGSGPPQLRLRRITALQADAESAAWLLAMRADQIEVQLNGVDPAHPAHTLERVTVARADASWVLPDPGRANGLPWMPRLQALLQRPGPAPGPATPSPADPAPLRIPRPPARLLEALGDARPTLEIVDSTLALLVDDPEQPGGKPVMLVEDLTGSVRPEEAGMAALSSIRGRLTEPDGGEAGRFVITANTTPGGALERARLQLEGPRLAQQLALLSDSVRLSERSTLKVDLLVTPHAQRAGLTLNGTVGLSELGFHAPRIHGAPVDGITVEADVNIDLDPAARRLVLDAPRIRVNERATLRLAATIDRFDGRLPSLDVRLRIPEQSCDDLLEAIPATMVPRLAGLKLSGTAKAHFDFEVDLEKPRSYDHDVDVDMRACRPVRYGQADVGRLNRRFTHAVREKGREIGVTVGPGTRDYVRLDRIPRHVRMGALWTEDQRFYQHSGFVVGLIERAVIMNLEGGRYRYGGSSITQQLVKNLFLSREKTLTRKLEEAILVWLVERSVTKNRILELYLNCIEYGPQLYGIGRAAQAYFGKHVPELSALEGAFLMGLKPYPWAGWEQLERGYVKPWWVKRLSKILEGMNRRGWLSDDDLEQSRPFEPTFVTSPHAAPDPPPSLDLVPAPLPGEDVDWDE